MRENLDKQKRPDCEKNDLQENGKWKGELRFL